MIKKDLYCFKNGKLELSILDESMDGDSAVSDEDESASDSSLDQDYTVSEELSTPTIQETQLKISEEIYNTLKTMGEFLTQTEDSDIKEIPQIMPEEEVQRIDEITKVRDYMGQDEVLQQNSIDALLNAHLGEVTPKFQYAMELKQKIEHQIRKIKDYR